MYAEHYRVINATKMTLVGQLPTSRLLISPSDSRDMA